MGRPGFSGRGDGGGRGGFGGRGRGGGGRGGGGGGDGDSFPRRFSDGGGRGGRGGRGGFGGEGGLSRRPSDGGGRGGGRGRGFGGRGGGGRGGRGGGGMRGGKKVIIEPHRYKGVYVVRGKEDAIATSNMVIGESVYGEKKVSEEQEGGTKIEYRIWNPFRSKLAAAIVNGIDSCPITPGSKVLYLGAASGTTVSHVSDIVGENGVVYAVEFSNRCGRDLVDLAKKRPNIVPIIEDARHPHKYRMVVGMVDSIFSDVAQPDQARILAYNAQQFLKTGGKYMISIKASCVDSTAPAASVFSSEVDKLRKDQLIPKEQCPLEPYERDHAVVTGIYRPPKTGTK